MKLFVTVTKKSLILTIAAVIAGILIWGWSASFASRKTDGSTHAIRMQYLASIGLKPRETPEEVKNIVIPEVFSDVYENYNQLQRRAGFDLADFKGKEATVYT